MALQTHGTYDQNSSPSPPNGGDTCSYAQHSLNEEKRLSDLYTARLRLLQQKVLDLTRLYEESERDATNKLHFWQSKFLATLQELKDSPTREEFPQELEQMQERIGALEHQLSICIGQGEEETSVHTFSRELLSRLKQSHQEKQQLTEELLRLKHCYTNISSSIEECSRQLERMAHTSDEKEGLEQELESAKSAIEQVAEERAAVESSLLQVRNENYELTQGMLTERRDGDEVRKEREHLRRELTELKNELKGRENDLEGRERDNETMVQRLESLRQEIDQLRRAVAARGRSYLEHKQAIPRELVESQSGELTDVSQEMVGLLDELTASRDKLQSYEELLANLRKEQTSQALSESVQIAELEQRLREEGLEAQACKAQSSENLRRKNLEVESSQQHALESNQRLTELLEKYSQLQQQNRDKSVACEHLEHRVADLNKALQTSLETQEQLVESFQSKQQDIDKLTGQANNLQRQLSKTTGKHILTKTQLQALNQQLKFETDRVRGYEEKLKESSLEKDKLQREIKLTQERSRAISDPSEELPLEYCPYQSEEPLEDNFPPPELRSVGVMVNSLTALSGEKKSPSNFSQNYRRALQKGLSQVELGESTSKVRENLEASPDSKLYWVRRVSEMSLQMKESSEYWSAQVKELTLQLEQLKQNPTETESDPDT